MLNDPHHPFDESPRAGLGSFYTAVTTLRLTSVMSRIRIDLTSLLDETSLTTFNAAAAACATCQHKTQCDGWIALTAEGTANPPPAFCPAVDGLRPVIRN